MNAEQETAEESESADCASTCTKHAYCRRERDVERLTRERDDALAALRRVVANESNHYDHYWTPAPEPLTDEWLDATEAKMREALTDAFCDDAAAVMLTLIAELRRTDAVRESEAEVNAGDSTPITLTSEESL